MKTFELKGVDRATVGKKAVKALRKEGMIPCVLYGGEKNGFSEVYRKKHCDSQKQTRE